MPTVMYSRVQKIEFKISLLLHKFITASMRLPRLLLHLLILCHCFAGSSSAACRQLVCQNGGNCSVGADSTERCSCDAGWGGAQCQLAKCGGFFTITSATPEGRIKSPTKFANESESVDGVECVWTIVGQPTEAIHLTFDYFEGRSIQGQCLAYAEAYAALTALDAQTITQPKICPTNESSFEWVSPANTLTLHWSFMSFGLTASNFRGFSARYRADTNNCLPKNPCPHPESSICIDEIGSTHRCICKPGFTGASCEIDIDDCQPNQCKNNATCIDAINSFTCQCPEGFTGPLCETEQSYCEVDSCLNGGTCVSHPGGYTCRCLNATPSQSFRAFGPKCENVTCEHSVLSGTSGHIYSPFYERSYANNLNCTWTIVAPSSGFVIALSFVQFKVEGPADQCIYDRLDLYRGNDINGHNLVERFCGESSPNPFFIEAEALTLQFRTDETVTLDGFDIAFTVKPTSPCASNPCLNEGSCSFDVGHPEFECSCVQGFIGRTCEIEIPVVQNGEIFTESRGSFSSAANITTANWTIARSVSSDRIELVILKLMLQESQNCRDSFLQIHAGPAIDKLKPFETRLCGSFSQRVIRVEYPVVQLEFLSSSAVPGFLAVQYNVGKVTSVGQCKLVRFNIDYCTTNGALYSCADGERCINRPEGYSCKCLAGYEGRNCKATCKNIVMPGDSGIIRSPRYPDVYVNRADCSWSVKAEPGQLIDVAFEQFDVLGSWPGCSGEDSVSIFDGAEPISAKLIGKFCGSSIRPRFRSESHELLVTFSSNYEAVGKGFLARYVVVSDITPSCADSQCQNSGKCTEIRNSTVCQCADGWQGKFCELETKCMKIQCSNGGTCQGGSCHCGPGWGGPTCSIAKCGGVFTIQNRNETGFIKSPVKYGLSISSVEGVDCSWTIIGPEGDAIHVFFAYLEADGSGMCSSGTFLEAFAATTQYDKTKQFQPAMCPRKRESFKWISPDNVLTLHWQVASSVYGPGFRGVSAKYASDENGCKPNRCKFPTQSVCLDEFRSNSPGYTCKCLSGYTGEDCETDIDDCESSPCLNGATCIDGVNSYKCECVPGFTGANCQDMTNFCDQERNACKNNGKCKPIVNGLTCECPTDPNFSVSGDRCEIVTCNQVPVVFSGATNGAFSTPLYGDKVQYANDLNCTWTVIVAKGQVLNIDFFGLELEGPPDQCIYDRLDIFQGTTTDGHYLMHRFCGDNLPKPITVESKNLTFQFLSDATIGLKGFALKFTVAAPSACASNPCRNNGDCKAVSINDYECSCPDDFAGQTCEMPVENRCTGRFIAPTGAFSLPKTDRECTWSIMRYGVTDQIQVHIHQLQFNLTPGSPMNCSANYLEFSANDGSSSTILRPYGGRICKLAEERIFTIEHRFVDIKLSAIGAETANFIFSYEINYCTVNHVTCAPGETCINTPQGYQCRCKEGILGQSCVVFCKDIQLPGDKGLIRSPRFPDFYTSNANCSWRIAAQPGQLIEIIFDQFDVEGVFPACSEDVVEIYDRNAANATASDDYVLLGRYCGSDVKPRVLSTSNEVLVVFHSDDNIVQRGFSAKYVAVEPACKHMHCLNGGKCKRSINDVINCVCDVGWAGRFCELDLLCTADYCANNGACSHVDGKPFCYCKQSFTGPRCELVHCGGMFFAGENITSPLYPTNYPNNVECWYLLRSPGPAISITFWEINLENSSLCQNDMIRLYKGWSIDPANFMGTICSLEHIPPVVGVSSGGMLLLVFKTDGSGTDKGFLATVNQGLGCEMLRCQNNGTCKCAGIDGSCESASCECPQGFVGRYCEEELCGYELVDQNSGFIATSGFPYSPYAANSDCVFTIRQPTGDHIRLRIERFETEPGADFVTIRDGPDERSPQLGRTLSGFSVGRFTDFVSTGNVVTVRFTSDDRKEFAGFNISFISAPKSVRLSNHVGQINSFEPLHYRPTEVFFTNFTVTYIIAPTAGHFTNMTIDIQKLEIISCGGAASYLDVYGGATHQLSFVKRFENHDKLPEGSPFELPYNQVTFELVSQGHCASGNHFNVNYRAYHDFCGLQQISCASSEVCFNGDNGGACQCAKGHKGQDCKVNCSSIELPENSGSFASPRFPDLYVNNANCSWHISTPDRITVIHLQITDVEGIMPHCVNDYIEVLDYDDSFIGRYCGNNIDITVRSLKESLQVNFVTDADLIGAGFQATYAGKDPATGCTGLICYNGGTCGFDFRLGSYICRCASGFSGRFCEIDNFCDPVSKYCLHEGLCSHGATGPVCKCPTGFTGPQCDYLVDELEIITSPRVVSSLNYPAPYPKDFAKIWSINFSDQRKGASIIFNDFELEWSSDRERDFLAIYNSTGDFVGQYAGDLRPPVINDANGVMTLIFVSDERIRNRGFTATLQSGLATCASVLCLHGGKCRSDGQLIRCRCPDGFSGNFCERDDLCEEFACKNGGTCVHVDDSKTTCACPPNFGGKDCSEVNCGGEFAYLTSSSIMSPRYPLGYPGNANCIWVIRAVRPSTVNISFVEVGIASPPNPQLGATNNGSCASADDVLSIYDGLGIVDQTQLSLQFCGSGSIPLTFQSTDSDVTIHFKSGRQETDEKLPGFKLEFSMHFENCTGFCHNGGTCIQEAHQLKCECRKGYAGQQCQEDIWCMPGTCKHNGRCYRNSDDFECSCPFEYTGRFCELVKCSQRIRNQTHGGIIRSPMFPRRYPPNSHCIWDIYEAVQSTIELKLVAFDLEADSDCSYDSLKVTICKDDNTCRPYGTASSFCGDTLPIFAPYVVEASSASGHSFIRLEFQSDESMENSGFDLRFSVGLTNPCTQGFCQNDGACDVVNGFAACACLFGWSGDRCQTDDICNSNPCINSGKCQRDKSSSRFSCICPKGVDGPRCENLKCTSNPCLHGGACGDLGTNAGYYCKCAAPYFGLNCQEVRNPCTLLGTVCGPGTCVPLADNVNIHCICPSGYHGELCDGA